MTEQNVEASFFYAGTWAWTYDNWLEDLFYDYSSDDVSRESSIFKSRFLY